jgi:hypothetical protein
VYHSEAHWQPKVRFAFSISIRRDLQIPKKIINLTTATMKMVGCKIKDNNELSEHLTTRKRLRQRDALACMLFNMALEKAVQASGIEKKVKYTTNHCKCLPTSMT